MPLVNAHALTFGHRLVNVRVLVWGLQTQSRKNRKNLGILIIQSRDVDSVGDVSRYWTQWWFDTDTKNAVGNLLYFLINVVKVLNRDPQEVFQGRWYFNTVQDDRDQPTSLLYSRDDRRIQLFDYPGLPNAVLGKYDNEGICIADSLGEYSLNKTVPGCHFPHVHPSIDSVGT